MLELLSFVLSASQRRPIINQLLTDPLILPPFVRGDSVSGRIPVVTETGDVTSPTTALALTGSNGIALTDGDSIVYANASIAAVQNVNELVFSLNIASPALNTALLTVSYINAFLEIRGTVATGQDSLLCHEEVTIAKTATPISGVPVSPSVIPGVVYNYLITTLRSAPTSLESMATLNLAVKTLLITSIGGQQQFWQLTSGTADPTDPTGQVAPLDNPTAVYWAKGLGL